MWKEKTKTMPARILPPVSRLRQLVDQGMTHQQIADLITRETGHPIGRSTVSAALHRAGEAQLAKKYPDEIPWRVREEHQTHYAPRMLRLLGRRRKGIANSEEMDARLDSWLKLLSDNGAVVTYVPDTEEGFFYVQGEPDIADIPIRREIPALKS